MYYHLEIDYGSDNKHYWWNRGKEGLINNVIIPILKGELIDLSDAEGHKLLNGNNVQLFRIFKTKHKLESDQKGVRPDEFDQKKFRETNCTEEVIDEIKENLRKGSSKTLFQQSLEKPLDQVFVIMKFGDEALDSAFEGVIEPVINEFGLDALRIDKIQDSGKITDQILESIARSKFILSDLSGERPNCYYEAGFSHAIGKEIIFTIKAGEKIHFDLAGYRFIEWTTEADLRRKLKARFKTLVKE